MPTKQATFDTVLAHMRRQGERAYDPEYGCRYRFGELACAAGCLIPNEDYTEDLEGLCVHLSDGRPTEVGQLLLDLGHDLAVVSALQRVHDDIIDPGKWEPHFAEVAAEFNLTYTPPAKEPA